MSNASQLLKLGSSGGISPSLLPVKLVVQGNVTAGQPIYFSNGVGITGTVTTNFIGYSLQTVTTGNIASLLIKPYSKTEYTGAVVGDRLFINSSGNLALNTSGYLIGYCLEAGSIYLLNTDVDKTIMKSVTDFNFSTSVGANTRTLPVVTGSGIVKELQIYASGTVNACTIKEILLTYDNNTDVVLDVEQRVDALTGAITPLTIPLNIEHRGNFTAKINYDATGATTLDSTIYYKEGF